jgi:O-antigen ligase
MRSPSGFDLRLEQAIGGLVLLSVAWMAVLFGGARPLEAGWGVGIVCLALVLWIARVWTNGSLRLLLPPVVWPVLAFAFYAAWRHSAAEMPYFSRLELLVLLPTVAVFFIALENLNRQETIQWLTHGLVALGALLAAYAVLQFVQKSDQILWANQPGIYLKRYGGTFVNPNHLAAFLVLLMPLGLAQAFLARGPAVMKILHGYAALVMLGGIAVTASRGGAIGAAASLVAFGLWLCRRRQFWLPLLALVVVVGAGATIFAIKAEHTRARFEAIQAGGVRDGGMFRPWLWPRTVQMWQDHFWLGVGGNHFDARFPAYRPPEIQSSPVYVHNEYLQLLVDYGTAGGLLVGAALVLLGYGVWRTSRHVERGSADLGMRQSNRTAFFAGSVAGLIGLGVHCFFDFNLHLPAIALATALVAGLLVSNTRFATERFWVTPNIVVRLVLTALLLPALVWLPPAAVNAALEDRYLARTDVAREVNAEYLTNLTTAALLAPDNPLTAYRLGEEHRRISLEGNSDWEAQAEAALKWSQTAQRINRHFARAVLTEGLSEHWLGRTNESLRTLERAARIGTNDFEIANALAWSYLNRGEYGRARQWAMLSTNVSPHGNWSALGYLYKLNLVDPVTNAPAGR